VDHIPELLNLGIRALKIEGRLKSPEYVAAVCQVYRKALDRALEGQRAAASDTDRYQLEMTFSRGLFPGWLEGVNHQELVPARYGKKRGPFAGKIRKVAKDHVEIRPETPLQPGDGVVFDTGEDPNREQGGRIFSIQDDRLFFRHGHIDFSRIKPGDRLWKTHDPALEKNLRRTFSGSVAMRRRIPLVAAVFGKAGEPLRVRVRAGSRTDDTFQFETEVASMEILAEANRAPLTRETLAAQLGRLEQSPFALESLENHLEGPVILPISALNKVRRALVAHLEEALPELAGCPRRETPKEWRELLADSAPEGTPGPEGEPVSLSVLCRDMPQVEAALGKRVLDLVLDFEDVRRYRDAVAWIREHASTDSPAFSPTVWLATPRIQKAGEHGFFRLLENASADGVLVRNLGALDFFKNRAARPTARLRGDFSLNVANPLTATEFLKRGMERLTLSYDLTAEQVCDLMDALPAVLRERIEITLHQHMPMFHMEHCVFAAFLSEGKSHLDCGRPCERHRVHLRDRVGVEHPLRADAGCRNTLFNAAAQTGAPFYETLHAAGLKRFRIELLEQTREQSERVIDAYRSLLEGNRSGAELWKSLRVKSQLGVTSGTLSAKLGA
jgi:putative protease